jgi:murein DD-endopeptidase MepM/ murein hydrolase activator NlpD
MDALSDANTTRVVQKPETSGADNRWKGLFRASRFSFSSTRLGSGTRRIHRSFSLANKQTKMLVAAAIVAVLVVMALGYGLSSRLLYPPTPTSSAKKQLTTYITSTMVMTSTAIVTSTAFTTSAAVVTGTAISTSTTVITNTSIIPSTTIITSTSTIIYTTVVTAPPTQSTTTSLATQSKTFTTSESVSNTTTTSESQCTSPPVTTLPLAGGNFSQLRNIYSNSSTSPVGYVHNGLDLVPAHNLDSVVSPVNGTVTGIMFWQNDRTGNWQININIAANCGSVSINMNLEPMSPNKQDGLRENATMAVSPGQKVLAGQRIASLLKLNDGSHVHFGVLVNGKAVCPVPYLTQDVLTTLEFHLHTDQPNTTALCFP